MHRIGATSNGFMKRQKRPAKVPENNTQKDRLGLQHFIEAQEDTYKSALREIKQGNKTGHWMCGLFSLKSGG